MALPNDLITPKQAAKLVGVGVSSIYRWIQDGTLRAWQVAGSHYRVSKAEALGLVREVQVGEPVRTSREDGEAAAAAMARMAARRQS